MVSTPALTIAFTEAPIIKKATTRRTANSRQILKMLFMGGAPA
jgi:hypothetical protein